MSFINKARKIRTKLARKDCLAHLKQEGPMKLKKKRRPAHPLGQVGFDLIVFNTEQKKSNCFRFEKKEKRWQEKFVWRR